MKINVLKKIWSHPATRGDRVNAIARALHWEWHKRVSKKPLTSTLIGNRPFKCYPNCGGSHVAITYRGLYDYHDMRFLERYLRRGDNFADIGANIGIYTSMVATLIGADGVLDAFEAAPKVLAVLRENVELNAFQNVRIHACALADHEGEISFTNANDLTNRIGIPSDNHAKQIHVPCHRLPTVVGDTQYAAMQLDVEGAEPLVLAGAKSMLMSGNPPVLLIEINSRIGDFGWKASDLVAWLREVDYDIGVYDAFSNKISFLVDSDTENIAELMGERDNAIAVHRPSRAFVQARIDESVENEGLDTRLNTAKRQPWPRAPH